MPAIDALRTGDLAQALADLQNDVRSSPDDPRHRVFLFQLLAVLGNWDRANAQLDVVSSLDPGAIAMVRTYESVLQCEVFRQGVFAGERTPPILGDPEPWIAKLVESLRLSAGGDHNAAQKLRADAYEEAPTCGGSLKFAASSDPEAGTTSAAFEWLADADSRLGPMLEAVVNGRYYWVPIHRLKRVDLEEPQDLRDLVWLPAHFMLANGGEIVAMIPTRYAGSEMQDDSQIRLARRTEWRETTEGVYEGLGQRILVTDADEYPLLNVRQIQFGE
jgi:type VI secretion system protein ImpE